MHDRPAERTTSRLGHKGPCGRRVTCWRLECQAEFRGLATVEILADQALAYCHGLTVPLDDPRLRAVAASQASI